MNRYEIKTYAKINLGLDVVRTLENGYHEVKMVMQTVGIYDVLTLEKQTEGISITTNLAELPTDDSSLVYKAARLMKEHYNIQGGVKIHLEANIPVAAGMAGGSTDAAATLKGMNELFGLGCSMKELQEIGVKIGADVPYCIMGGTALAEGIGEKLTALPPAPNCFLVVAKPDMSVATKHVYDRLDEVGIAEHPDIDGMVEAIAAGSLSGVIERLGNVLEYVTVPEHPIVDTIKTRMRELGAAGSLMSGSGPTVFGIFTEKETAEAAFRQLKKEELAKQLFVTTFV